MEKALKHMAEVLEHLVYSHTFRSEHTQRRVHELLASIRGALAPPAAAESTPGEEAGNSQAGQPGADSGTEDGSDGS